MLDYSFLLSLALILLSTKVFGLVTRKISIPSVVGALLAGIILGPSLLNIVSETEFLKKFAELGVIILMFLAGIDTDFEELKKTGVASLIIAIIGVIVPFGGGFLAYRFFYPGASQQHMLEAIFMGVVLTATSVSITVEALQELGKLKTRMGTAILGAAVIDDIIGIVVLTLAVSSRDTSVSTTTTIIKILGFFVFTAVVGLVAYFIFKYFHLKYGEKRRMSIYALVFCLLMAFCSEHFFGVAAITGSYFAGIILCNIGARQYIARKINVASYLVFSPVFFASIGIGTSFAGFSVTVVLFAVLLLVVAVVTKIIGCGVGALLCKFSPKDSLCIGIGMVSRGEVALIVAQIGITAGVVRDDVFPAVVLVVVITTLITPILLKMAIGKPVHSNIISITETVA